MTTTHSSYRAIFPRSPRKPRNLHIKMDKNNIPKPELLKALAIALNKEIEDLLKEVEFRIERIKKLAVEIPL